MAQPTETRKQIVAIAERIDAIAHARGNASAALLRKWAREIRECLKREDE